MEDFESVDLLPDTREQDRRTGDGSYRQRGTTPRITIELGHDDAAEG